MTITRSMASGAAFGLAVLVATVHGQVGRGASKRVVLAVAELRDNN